MATVEMDPPMTEGQTAKVTSPNPVPRFPRLMSVGPPPTLTGHRCTVCQRVAFPPDPYGCEQCGAEPSALVAVSLVARGQVHAVATVHRHHQPEPATPFTVATIVLDDGPTLKAVLVDSAEVGEMGAVEVGAVVVGASVVTGTSDDGADLVDLGFELEVTQ